MISFRHTPPGIEGYAVEEVDAFVAQLEAALAQQPPAMRPEDVHTKVFHIKRVHAAYDEREVDAFLDDAEHRLREAFGQPDLPSGGRRYGWLHAVGTAVIVAGLALIIAFAVRLLTH